LESLYHHVPNCHRSVQKLVSATHYLQVVDAGTHIGPEKAFHDAFVVFVVGESHDEGS